MAVLVQIDRAEFECEKVPASAIRAAAAAKLAESLPEWDRLAGMGWDGKGLMKMEMMTSADVSSWTGAGRKGGDGFFLLNWKNEVENRQWDFSFLFFYMQRVCGRSQAFTGREKPSERLVRNQEGIFG